ncbi:hypothetical protein DFH11DRAFT_1628621 [Phellopilus nigrolimitatus]|nr:hypothetical protein DFH11DRAFT_1628621 [Phellopilus nigrolimitatus]
MYLLPNIRYLLHFRVPYSTTSMATPAAELQGAVSDAVSAFLKAANHALASVEDANKDNLRQAALSQRDAQRERDELRRERDALLQEKMNAAIELETVKSEAKRWKAATEKAEWMINHQAESIAQLRREAQQWKDQFVRVDEERSRLSTRNDELVSQQLYANRRDTYHQEPLTPRSQGPQAQSSSSASTRATSSNRHATPVAGYATDGDIVKRRTSESQAQAQTLRKTPRHAKSQPQASTSASVSRTLSQSAPRVIRRVHVTMQDSRAVKEESLEGEQLLKAQANRSESVGDDEVPVPPKLSNGKRPAPAQHQAARRRWSEDKRIYDEESEESGSGSDGDGDGDEYTPNSRVDDEDEDDDELMLGGEVCTDKCRTCG